MDTRALGSWTREQLPLFLNRGHILLGWSSAFAKEVLLHLFNDSLLILPASGIEAILVQQHLAELRPTSPRFLGGVIVNLLSEFRGERGLIQTWKFPLQLDTENFALSHGSPRDFVRKLSHTRVGYRRGIELKRPLKKRYCGRGA